MCMSGWHITTGGKKGSTYDCVSFPTFSPRVAAWNRATGRRVPSTYRKEWFLREKTHGTEDLGRYVRRDASGQHPRSRTRAGAVKTRAAIPVAPLLGRYLTGPSHNEDQ